MIEYTETPYQLISFEQISGDAKFYKGTQRLVSEKDKTAFKYDSLVEFDSLVPSFVISYFIKNNIRSRIEVMAKHATQHKTVDIAKCKQLDLKIIGMMHYIDKCICYTHKNIYKEPIKF